jgi:hypothetical protein
MIDSWKFYDYSNPVRVTFEKKEGIDSCSKERCFSYLQKILVGYN